MSERVFKFSLFGLVAAILLSATTSPGALLGFLFGIAIAFFVAGPSMLAASALQGAGIPVTMNTILIILFALYALLTVAAILQGWRAWNRDAPDLARGKVFLAAFMTALPLMAWLSVQALTRAL